MRGRVGDGEIGGWFSPLIDPALLEKRLRNGSMAHTDIGLVKRCSRCKELWPFDTEFFFASAGRTDGLYQWCRACYVEYRWPDGMRHWSARRDAQGVAA